jgi:hypothetical protein
MHDCLARLAGCHRVLRFHDIRSVDAYRAASRDQIAQTHHPYRALIYRLVSEGHPDVMAALSPPVGVTWQVAGLTGDPTVGLLSAKRAPLGLAGGELLSMTYDFTDADGDWPTWNALKAVLQ